MGVTETLLLRCGRILVDLFLEAALCQRYYVIKIVYFLRERERDRQTERETDRQTERETDRQRERDRERQTDRERERERERVSCSTICLFYWIFYAISIHVLKMHLCSTLLYC